jgi:hypothetical protein
MRSVLVGLALVGLVAVASASTEQKFGKGVTLTEATPLKALFETPEKYVGKTIRIDGIVTNVCEDMGCWMAVGEKDKADDKDTLRLTVDHHGGIVFPISAKGKAVSAEGVFQKVAATDKESKGTIVEQAAVMKVSDWSKTYQLKTVGAVVK